MKYEVYDGIKIKSDFSSFEFVSEGHNGIILKRIQFAETASPNIYNLAFGDVKENGDLDDLTTSNNGDRNKILATVLKVVEDYTNNFPERYVFFSGSTEHRTRLYRMAIDLNYDELSLKFEIYVDIKGVQDFVPFQKGLNVRAFLIKRKFTKFDI